MLSSTGGAHLKLFLVQAGRGHERLFVLLHLQQGVHPGQGILQPGRPEIEVHAWVCKRLQAPLLQSHTAEAPNCLRVSRSLHN